MKRALIRTLTIGVSFGLSTPFHADARAGYPICPGIYDGRACSVTFPSGTAAVCASTPVGATGMDVDCDATLAAGTAVVYLISGWLAGTVTAFGNIDGQDFCCSMPLAGRNLSHATITGSGQDDFLYFTYASGASRWNALPSAYNLASGSGGHDHIEGADSTTVQDHLAGYNGNDTIFGWAGYDTILGGIGADFLYGGSEIDYIDGEADGDTIFGDEGEDTIIGGTGNDTLFGGDDDDLMAGGSNDDVMYGDGGFDDMIGESGNDAMSGGDDDDDMHGGTGNDVVCGDSNVSGDILDDGDTSSGVDWLVGTTTSTEDYCGHTSTKWDHIASTHPGCGAAVFTGPPACP